MRFAYADPPYPGQSKRHYGDHPDYAGEVDHAELVERLREYDGWALSTSNRSLADVLVLTGPERVLAWCKPIAPPFPGLGVYGWEPVIVKWARPPASDLRDTLTVSPEQYTFRPKPEGYVTRLEAPGVLRMAVPLAWRAAGRRVHRSVPRLARRDGRLGAVQSTGGVECLTGSGR